MKPTVNSCNMLDELLILNKVKEGDIKAFEDLFRRYYSPLCWFAAGIIGDIHAAEEIVEELFYVFWRDRERLQVFCSVKSYLYRAVRNEAVQYCQHREVEERYRRSALDANGTEPSGDDIEAQLEYKELEMLIQHTLQRLPERRLRIFKMHRMEAKKYTEIATLLSISVKTVEAEMTKALRVLRAEVDNYIRGR